MFSSAHQGRKGCQKPSLRIPGPFSDAVFLASNRWVQQTSDKTGKLTLSLSRLSKIVCLFLLRRGNAQDVTLIAALHLH